MSRFETRSMPRSMPLSAGAPARSVAPPGNRRRPAGRGATTAGKSAAGGDYSAADDDRRDRVRTAAAERRREAGHQRRPVVRRDILGAHPLRRQRLPAERVGPVRARLPVEVDGGGLELGAVLVEDDEPGAG